MERRRRAREDREAIKPVLAALGDQALKPMAERTARRGVTIVPRSMSVQTFYHHAPSAIQMTDHFRWPGNGKRKLFTRFVVTSASSGLGEAIARLSLRMAQALCSVRGALTVSSLGRRSPRSPRRKGTGDRARSKLRDNDWAYYLDRMCGGKYQIESSASLRSPSDARDISPGDGQITTAMFALRFVKPN